MYSLIITRINEQFKEETIKAYSFDTEKEAERKCKELMECSNIIKIIVKP